MDNPPIAFNDGICTIYSVENRNLKEKLGCFNFKEETVGIKAYSEFHLIGIEIERVISIPYNPLINNGYVVAINGSHYDISLIQKKDTFPKSWRMTLSKSPMRWNDDKVFRN